MRFHRGAGDYTDMVRGLAFSPGGTKLASPSLDGTTGVYTLNLDEWVARRGSPIASPSLGASSVCNWTSVHHRCEGFTVGRRRYHTAARLTCLRKRLGPEP